MNIAFMVHVFSTQPSLPSQAGRIEHGDSNGWLSALTEVMMRRTTLNTLGTCFTRAVQFKSESINLINNIRLEFSVR